MLNFIFDPEDHSTLKYIITHVFCPLRLPDGDDRDIRNDCSLAGAIAAAAHLFVKQSSQANDHQWHSILKMLDNLEDAIQLRSLDGSKATSQLGAMHVGDVVVFLIRAQNAAAVFRKQDHVTIFESFEVSPKTENVMTAQGKLICSYPGPAIEIPNVTFHDKNFISQLVNFLVHMNSDVLLDVVAKTQKAQSTVHETRDATHPRYITELLTGVLRSVGSPADVTRISKRVGDDVVWNNSKLPWRRSPLWLLIRVVLQTTLERSTLQRAGYKELMLFFMCCLGKEEGCENLSNDYLQFMLAKISRRLQKLGSSAPDWLSRIVLETCTSLRQILQERWAQVQVAQRVSPPWNPSGLDLSQDVQLSLLNCREHIHNCLANRGITSNKTSFSPTHRTRGDLEDFLSSNGSFFDKAYRSEPHVTLYDVELAVEQEIDDWVDDWVDEVTKNNDACVQLEILANKYSSGALRTYGENPELLSVMMMTMIELWIALDKIAIMEIPMLRDYSPEVPVSLLGKILVFKTTSLDRLRRAYLYLSQRHSQSRWSVFSSTVTTSSFAIRYYEGSSHLQSLKSKIEDVARREEREKIAELEAANDRHAELGQQAADIEHSYYTDYYGVSRHSKHCNKCDLERQRKNMEITVHEWPLPAEKLRAKEVVFELDCPIAFNMWRTATFHLLLDLCSPTPDQKIPYIELENYGALQPYFVLHARSRVSLASNTKPFTVSHYHKQSIPTIKPHVCVSNGLSYYGFDSRAGTSVSGAIGDLDINKYCTYQIQSGPYKNLQLYVDTTSHLSNEVIAHQVDCHKDLTLHEFLAFGHLRSGGVLQWLNILRELRSRTLSFRHNEVHFLLAQAVSQAGPLADGEWVWHQELGRPEFCRALLRELGSLLRNAEANWLERVTMDTISFLLRRLLSSSPDEEVSHQAIELLRVVRSKVFKWVEELSEKLTKTPGDDEFCGFLRDSAAICRSTYDVVPDLVSSVLDSAEDVDVLISCAILIHDYTPSKITSLPPYSQLLLDRDRRLSLTLEDVLSDVIRSDPDDEGIDRSISRIWCGYRPGSKWNPLKHPNSRWFSCTTKPTAEQRPQVVHFNLLNGSLLVDGKPLGRLPVDITRHKLYDLIFDGRVLDVVPGDIPGMDYSTRGLVFGHQVYFSLRNGSDLVIQAKRSDNHVENNDQERLNADDSGIIVLIPHEKLEGDLPAVLIERHAHWLNISTSVLEIRPLDSVWKTSSENWMIDCSPGKYRMRKGGELLVDIRSKSWTMVSDLLRPLDDPSNIVVSVSPVEPSSSWQLSVVLPHYSLSFYVDEDGDFQSGNFRGMVYDKNQCMGTLFGLVNRLVLRPKIKGVDAVDIIPRCVIIPEGDVSFQEAKHHVHVKIKPRRCAFDRITYHAYTINTDLGCLSGGVSLTSKLYYAYLHALTSGCSVDPLTGRSGTEEALSLLWSASYWSIMKFSDRDAELLKLIASVCPSREWYPKHLKCMQEVKWNDLPVNSQHHELYIVARAIKTHFERFQSFHESRPNSLLKEFPSQEDHLLGRAARRASYLLPFSSAWNPSGPGDVVYSARDLVDYGSGEHRAYTAATTVYRQTPSEKIGVDILSLLESWARTGAIDGDYEFSLQYDSSWLSPKFRSIWLEVYNLLRTSDEDKWFQLLFSLPAMAYALPEHSDLVPVFVSFAAHQQFRSEDPPHYESYNLCDKYDPCASDLRNYVSDSAYSFKGSPESSGSAQPNESLYDLRQRQLKSYRARLDSDIDATVDRVLESWPCETPPKCSLNRSLYDVKSINSNIQVHFSSRYHNLKLKEHLFRVQDILRNVQVSPAILHQYSFGSSQCIPSNAPWKLTTEKLLSRQEPSIRAHIKLSHNAKDSADISFSGAATLDRLITTTKAKAGNEFERRYVSALGTSADYFKKEMLQISHGSRELPNTEALTQHYTRCREHYAKGLRKLQWYLGPGNLSQQVLEKSGQWPRMTPCVLLGFLASNSSIMLSGVWKGCLIELALLALEVQRARRLLRLGLDNHLEELRGELQNEGCVGWNAETYPDWLLVQLQCNFFVRPVQAEVAHEMISPRSDDNTAMQLNMGEGKSSVIVPIVVAVLADGNQLVRVIVPKALTAQMFRLLVDRLGGLTNRRIYFLPFSRSQEVDHERATEIREIMSECMKERGILVVQPEHVLSLKLVSVEKQLPDVKDAEVGFPLLELQKWLHSCSRDILDESDEILHVRYQLVYTIGNQGHVEGFPERWTSTQQILSLIKKYASSLKDCFPLGVEYEHTLPGSFPHIRILHPDAGETLISWILEDVIEGYLPNFSFGQLRSDIQDAVRSFISCKDVPDDEVRLIEEHYGESHLRSGLLLLRGLLTTGILLFAFRDRRWRVDYGLAPPRTMLAVPYRAKDVPAQKAEFGHPDVAVILTCLSYYYGGLDEKQLWTSFEILHKQDDPSVDYDLWVRECPCVPESLKAFGGINIKSSDQWRNCLFPLFHRNKATVDFYLSRVVFPKEAKEFPYKLSCSGWDLAEKRDHLLTGFSGTNDGQYLLPLHITQCDPDHQRGTNAKVLSYLLQPENGHYKCITHKNGTRPSTREFLETLVAQKPEIRVLLDVGAQMLELQNRQLAETWLNVNPSASAAIYFNEDDELTVSTRDGRTQLLFSSPFARQLDQCVVYLDDAHTRGTDIKFPSGFRAAVTLGPKVTKDRLVQGCMRMRKLGHGHSIMIFAPLEVDRRIRSVANLGPKDDINTIHILHWAIRETCDEIHYRAPHWAQQGMDHSSRYIAWSGFCKDQLTPKELSDQWLQREAKRLEELYGLDSAPNISLADNNAILQRCKDLGILSLRDVSMDEEQEREVIHEVERERQVERPPKALPAIHSTHPDVIAFVTKGIIPANSKAFRPVFKTLDTTSAVTDEAHVWSSSVLATRDFQQTVKSHKNLDDFLRPVQWIVSSEIAGRVVLVILSPYEASHLIPQIRTSDTVHLHLYTPRVTRSVKPCDDLDLYRIPAISDTKWTAPSLLMDQLNLFAGQLYLKDYKTYIQLCRFLCMYTRDIEDEEGGIEAECDGFIAPSKRPLWMWMESMNTFQSTPLHFLRELMGIRRKGMQFTLTHMGRLLDGRLLSEDDFE